MNYRLSYIIATYNRLPLLKITLGRLITSLQPDEEIVVVGGDSTDGTKEYLQQLVDEGKIHQFISEPDKNQAHGWNKAMLMAKGTLIKKIIDDDVFCYSAIRECKNYMLQNPAVDVVISNDLGSTLNNYKSVQKHSRLPWFEEWSAGHTSSFTFGDVHMLVRKSALAYIGLYHTAYVMMDWEYSLRISYLKTNIAYYTGYNALSVTHPQTVTATINTKLIIEQGERGRIFYEYAGDASDISVWSKIKIHIGTKLLKPNTGITQEAQTEDMDVIYKYYYNYIDELNRSLKPMFIEKI